ncbi:hypothetical protein RA280_42900 [Cupriavidus sp. CV2]|uniref:hypothetical protein n=1 Tax=Cupriavidus ulmosensis TaxID=3065913 RepID=UPI00296B17C4|nr:hypothetical protein [Cupriavidus sp. CV2]MDW3688367.1 hypothetical protein [Cupriavidus sp. CV2]
MKTLYSLLITAPLLLGGCKLDLDTHSVDRFRLFASDGLILRLNTETGEIARVTATGITPLSDVSDSMPPDVKALVDKYTTKPASEPRESTTQGLPPPPPGFVVDKETTKPASELKPGESTTQGLPPGWSVKRDN